jgi:hypothetical protein
MLMIADWRNYSFEQKKSAIEKYATQCHLDDEQTERLIEGLVLADRFFYEAHKVANHRDHYSARTIVEVLRHNSVLEDGDKTFKINDHIIPLLSRISMQMFPALNGLFETRSKSFKLEMQ